MKSRQFRRRCAIAGATATIAIATAVAPAQGSTASAPRGGTADRPCFMVRAHWNTGYDGPQPTCPVPTWQMADPAFDVGAMPDTRIPDFMP